jgi:hypothetical protein
MRKALALSIAALILVAGAVSADAVTIYDVQYSELPDYVSPLTGNTVTVTGGIVTNVFAGFRTRIVIQDPTLGPAWAGILVSCDAAAVAPAVQRGDQVDFIDVVVEEYRGNTQLDYYTTSSYVINSSGNSVAPLIVSTAVIPVPVNHDLSEPYEFMLLTVQNVHVGAMDLGKAGDNYELINAEGTCWGSDYVNVDLPPGSLYYVTPGACYASVTGYLEQYTKLDAGWDYYQLLPRDAQDYMVGASATENSTWSGVKSMFR